MQVCPRPAIRAIPPKVTVHLHRRCVVSENPDCDLVLCLSYWVSVRGMLMAKVGAMRDEESGSLCHSHLGHRRRCHHLHARHSHRSRPWCLQIAPSMEIWVAGHELPLGRKKAEWSHVGWLIQPCTYKLRPVVSSG